jgi:hypothetical protein
VISYAHRWTGAARGVRGRDATAAPAAALCREGKTMSIEQSRAKLTGRIWQAIGQSGVSLDVIPRAQQERLVAAIASEMLITLDEMLDALDDSTGAPDAGGAGGGDEQVLWEGRPFLSLFLRYTVTNQRIRIRRGLFSRDIDDIELIRLQDVDLAQKLTERMVNIGDITLHSADKSAPTIVLQNVHEPERVHEIIRRAMLDARRRYGVRLRDEV